MGKRGNVKRSAGRRGQFGAELPAWLALPEVQTKPEPASSPTPEKRVRSKPRPSRNFHYAADRHGEPCACGTSPGQVCLAHHALTGHRRHVRPE